MRTCFAIITLALALSACGGDEDGGPNAESLGIDCSDDVPTFDEVTAFETVCTNCHASSLSGAARNGAPAGYDFDRYERAADEAGEIAEYVNEGLMPPPDSGLSISAAERQAILRWSVCGTPE
jgi:cytochrome c5